ncbi:LPXTG cell wall anchor domain-containing protein, partial [Streptococcus infantis]|uniref:LPXTG cell wall anchor domain-containing protein n=1 Tax=Streptococcus infantis TaxID=68892 RepID=UPI0039C1C823
TTTPSSTSETTTTEDKPGLPNTGESKGTLITIIGAVTLISSIVAIAFFRIKEKK